MLEENLSSLPKLNDIVCIKLSNGDELIAKLLMTTDKVTAISKPFLMVLAQDPVSRQPGVQLAPFWMLGADDNSKYILNNSLIVCTVKANSEAKKGYDSHTSSLLIPNSGLIV